MYSLTKYAWITKLYQGVEFLEIVLKRQQLYDKNDLSRKHLLCRLLFLIRVLAFMQKMGFTDRNTSSGWMGQTIWSNTTKDKSKEKSHPNYCFENPIRWDVTIWSVPDTQKFGYFSKWLLQLWMNTYVSFTYHWKVKRVLIGKSTNLYRGSCE
jgi:hypothetical protein